MIGFKATGQGILRTMLAATGIHRIRFMHRIETGNGSEAEIISNQASPISHQIAVLLQRPLAPA